MARRTSILRNNSVIAERAAVLDGFVERLVGLLGRDRLEPSEAVIFPRCSMVHMFGMKFSIDLVFCSREGEILCTCRNLRPWRISPYVAAAHYAIELPLGSIAQFELGVGDVLTWAE